MWLGTLLLLATLNTAFGGPVKNPLLTQLPGVYTGPLTFDFMTPSTIVLTERTSVSTLNLNTLEKTLLIGSTNTGGYVDGTREEARFSLINDIVVQGNYMYIADFSCVRIYDMELERMATLAGVCGRMEEFDALPTMSTASPAFKGHLKLAVSARELYVLDGDKISRVDRETGVARTLTTGEKLTGGTPTSLEIDIFSNTLFVAVAKPTVTDILAVNIESGKQTLYQTIDSASSNGDITATVASIDIAPDRKIFVLEPHALHSVDPETREVTNQDLNKYGYHELAVSSQFLVISQEYYSRMYRLHIMNMTKDTRKAATEKHEQSTMADQSSTSSPVNILQSQTFYLAIVIPSVLFLLVIIVILCATKIIIRSRSNSRFARTVSESSSEKYFLEGAQQEAKYWS